MAPVSAVASPVCLVSAQGLPPRQSESAATQGLLASALWHRPVVAELAAPEARLVLVALLVVEAQVRQFSLQKTAAPLALIPLAQQLRGRVQAI